MKKKLKELTSDEIIKICESHRSGMCATCPLNNFGDWCTAHIVPMDEETCKILDKKYGEKEIQL